MILKTTTKISLLSLALVALVTHLSGCHISNRVYRQTSTCDSKKDPSCVNKSVVAVQPPPTLPMSPGSSWPTHPQAPCSKEQLSRGPCLAFLEFDDFGEYWQRNPSGRASQLAKVLDLIDEAKKQDKFGQPLILTFIHGWKHNASEGARSGADDPNIIGVEQTLNALHSGPWSGHVVIGIYIAWRGGLIKSIWPVSQQFTYWNREATATRVGNTSLTDALIEISGRSRRRISCKPSDLCVGSPDCTAIPPLATSEDNSCSPILLFVGHSFGALVLERALSQATVTRMEREWEEATLQRRAATTDRIPIKPLADLVIYVNSAAAATESKQVIDYLASSRFIYRPTDGIDRPLFLSVTSETDVATGLFLKVGHAVPLVGFKMNGSMRSSTANPGTETADWNHPSTHFSRACFDPNAGTQSSIREDISQTDYFMSTTAHKAQLWSHLVTSSELHAPLGAAPSCERSSTNGPVFAVCEIGEHRYEISVLKDRCNGTPYWVLQVQKEIIPDHGTIFTKRLIAFLTPFIPEPRQLGEKAVRPQLSRPSPSLDSQSTP